MRLLLVICIPFLAVSVYSQNKIDKIIDSTPILKINKQEHTNTNTNLNVEKKRDSFPITTIHETYYEGRKIRVVTEYTAP
ncbi:MAG: hypothetical protein JNL75_08010 [Chitinophagales bacterium]|nr:hypothetical protein [Chitinophagales bacterium]